MRDENDDSDVAGCAENDAGCRIRSCVGFLATPILKGTSPRVAPRMLYSIIRRHRTPSYTFRRSHFFCVNHPASPEIGRTCSTSL